MAAFAKIKDLGVFDIAGLVKDVLPMVTTDLSLWDITGYAMDVMNIGTDEIAHTGFRRMEPTHLRRLTACRFWFLILSRIGNIFSRSCITQVNKN